MCKNENFDKFSALKKEDKGDQDLRLTWSGDKFHDISLSEEATLWQNIFQVVNSN